MNLYEKIKKLKPELTDADFAPEGTIMLQNDSDGKGDYIREWNHPTVTQPTNAELNGVS
jgi:hypothetical protein